ncbi:MAG: hypothetical protein ACRCWM_06520 [Sarcina sp.]
MNINMSDMIKIAIAVVIGIVAFNVLGTLLGVAIKLLVAVALGVGILYGLKKLKSGN